MTLAAFRIRSFRFQFPADLLTSWAVEMEMIILAWYVMVSTGSVLLLTAFAALQYVGTLAAPMFGVLGDRLGGRFMLCAMRATYAVFGAATMILALSGRLSPAWVFTLAAVSGVVRPNDLVMRNTLIGETIPAAHLMGALGFSRATQDSARVAGALAGAGLSTALGIGPAYIAITLLYMMSLTLTFGVARGRPAPDPTTSSRRPPTGSSSGWRDLKEGLVYVVRSPAVFATMWLAFMVNLTAYPVSSGLLPYVARNVYKVDATGLGWLVASFSLGGLIASITMVAAGGMRRPERSMVIHIVLWYAMLLGFGYAPTFGSSLLALTLAGFVQNVAMISMAAALLADAGDRFRGRVMGVRQLAVYGMLPGLLGSGALVEYLGYAPTVTACCAIGLLFTVLIAVKWRASVWQRERPLVTAARRT